MLNRLILSLVNTGPGNRIADLHRLEIVSWMPIWLIPFIIIGLIGLCYYQYSKQVNLSKNKRVLLIILRSVAYTCLLFIVARPMLEISGEGTAQGPVPIIIDGTESMKIRDVKNGSRINMAWAITTNLLARGKDYKELHLIPYISGKEFSKISNRKGLRADETFTSLNQMLMNGIKDNRGTYIPGVVFLSDGVHNTYEVVDKAIEQLIQDNIPVYICGLGQTKTKDVSINTPEGESVVFNKEKASIRITVNQSGYLNRSSKLKLYMDGQLIKTKSVTFSKRGDNTFSVEYIPQKTGKFLLKAEVAPFASEKNRKNNKATKYVRVIEEKIKVLMVFGTPSWEYTYLKTAMDRDKKIEYKVYLKSIDPRLIKRQQTYFLGSLPADVEELHKNYDVIFLSRIDARTLPEGFLEALPAYVGDYGGGVVIISDSSIVPYSFKNTALESLLPVKLGYEKGMTYREELTAPKKSPLSFELTTEGDANPIVNFTSDPEKNKEIWSRFPPIFNIYAPRKLKPSSISLLVVLKGSMGEQVPAVIQHYFGKGSALYMGFDSSWRWRKKYGDLYFREFWGKVIQTIGLPHLLSETADSMIMLNKETCFVGERIALTAKINIQKYSPHQVKKMKVIILEKEYEKTFELLSVPGRPGIYKSFYSPEKSGDVILKLPEQFNARPVTLTVAKEEKEMQTMTMNIELLRKIAQDTKGMVYNINTIRGVLGDILNNRPELVMHLRFSVWDSIILLIATLAFFSAEWFFRKKFYLD